MSLVVVTFLLYAVYNAEAKSVTIPGLLSLKIIGVPRILQWREFTGADPEIFKRTEPGVLGRNLSQ